MKGKSSSQSDKSPRAPGVDEVGKPSAGSLGAAPSGQRTLLNSVPSYKPFAGSSFKVPDYHDARRICLLSAMFQGPEPVQ